MVIASSRSAVSRSASGDVGISSGTQMSLPIAFWYESVCSFVIETCPYTESWNEPESVMITPSKSRSLWSPSSFTRSLYCLLWEKM